MNPITIEQFHEQVQDRAMDVERHQYSSSEAWRVFARHILLLELAVDNYAAAPDRDEMFWVRVHDWVQNLRQDPDISRSAVDVLVVHHLQLLNELVMAKLEGTPAEQMEAQVAWGEAFTETLQTMAPPKKSLDA